MEVTILTITDKSEFQNGIKRVIITEEEIQREIKKCADQLSTEYEGKPLLLVSILKGAFIFLSTVILTISEEFSSEHHLVNQRGFSMVNVRDNRNISNVLHKYTLKIAAKVRNK